MLADQLSAIEAELEALAELIELLDGFLDRQKSRVIKLLIQRQRCYQEIKKKHLQ